MFFTEIGDAGNITINSSEGNIDTTADALRAFSQFGSGGTIDLDAAGNITTGNVNVSTASGQGGSVNINSDGGVINTSQGNLIALSSGAGDGGKITLTVPGNITTSNVNVSSEVGDGGTIEINSTGGAINTSAGALRAFANVIGNGGTIDLDATGDINTGNVNTTASLGSGGTIDLNSSNGSINSSGFINSPGVTGGGNINLGAENEINIQEIRAFSSNRNGGNVTLATNNGDLEVEAIDAVGDSNFQGGDITITSGGAFRVTGTFTDQETGLVASISSAGGVGGTVTIEHEDSSPFTIGNSNINGTAGSIIIGDVTISNNESLGTAINQNQIEIIEPNTNLPEEISLVDLTQLTTLTTSYVASTPEITDTSDVLEITTEEDSNNSSTVADAAVEDVEDSASSDFGKYFGITSTSKVTREQAQDILSNIVANTNAKPALIYTSFSPRSNGELELKLILVTDSGDVIQKQVLGATRKDVVETAQKLRRDMEDLGRERVYLPKAQQLYKWLIEPLEPELAQQEISNLVFVMDAGLRSIPLAALHDGQKFIIENYSVGLMPSLSLTDTNYVKIGDLSVLGMGAETFSEQISLPGVAFELKVITEELWPGESLLNQDFTVENLKRARRDKSYGMIHLATHAEFKRGEPANSFIQFNNEKLPLDRLRELGLSNSQVELMVLSACRTALGDEEAELGFAGLAHQAGVKTVLGSLWYVSDAGTLVLMSEFYERLKTAPIKG